jgi:hypothetical protein
LPLEVRNLDHLTLHHLLLKLFSHRLQVLPITCYFHSPIFTIYPLQCRFVSFNQYSLLAPEPFALCLIFSPKFIYQSHFSFVLML